LNRKTDTSNPRERLGQLWNRTALTAARFASFASRKPVVRCHIDAVWNNRVLGWAVDLNDPDKFVTVDVYSGDQLVGSAIADQFREDLLEAGLGHGRHAFSCELPSVDRPTTIPVRVRARGSDNFFNMGESEVFEAQLHPPPFIKYIAADIVNNCNLRCPFCLVDYSQVDHTELMPVETFQKILSLVDRTGDEGFWMSCLHEPTMHPKLNDFLALIPSDNRRKTWFTTNLTRPLTEEFFTVWAQSGIHHINVSLDSLNPELFAVLRKFGRFEVFQRNLDLMTDVFRRQANPPKLRFITMAFKSNLEEIPTIVQHSNERWLSSENEIRYTLNFEHIADSFRQEHYLLKTDWPILTEKLAALPYNYAIVYPPEKYEELIVPSSNLDSPRPALTLADPRFQRPLCLRARPNGSILVVGHEGEFSIDVRSLPDPAAFFENLSAIPPNHSILDKTT
jgi:sulfatase maturation enzyme AslB (radical SAM superfamily)